MPSLRNTLRRWYWTVRGLMNSWAPISGFVRPSRASRAICASCAVSSSRVSTRRLRTVSPVARSSRRARSANASTPIVDSMSCGGAQLLAGVDAPALAPQPLAVQQVRAGELDAEAGAAEALERLAVGRLGGFAIAASSARTRASMPSAQSVGVRSAPLGEPVERGRQACRVAGPRRRLGQLRHDDGPEPQVIALEYPPARRRARRRIGRGRCRAPRSRYVAALMNRPIPRASASRRVASISSVACASWPRQAASSNSL